MMDKLERLKGKFRLVITTFVFLLLLTTAMMGAFQSREIDDSELDDAKNLESSPLPKAQKSTSLSANKNGLFLDLVDESENTGEHTSIEIQEVGHKKLAYISYYSESSEALKIAKNDIRDPESGWERWTIDHEGDVGRHSSLELDGNTKAHIAYYDETNTRLKYTLWCGENKSVEYTEVIDESGKVGKYASLELDEDDDPSVSYYDSSQGGLKYAEREDGGWQTLMVDDDGENRNRSMIWNFTTSSDLMEGHSLQINIEGNGTVDIDPEKKVYEEGTQVVLNAIPDEGWFFKNWTGDHKSREKETNITMDGDKNIDANFEELEDHLLTIDIEGEGTTNPSQGRYTYEDGDNVTIQAAPEKGWHFVE